jgi:GT2 family glycosyltransferase
VRRCIASIRRQIDSLVYEIIVVDNASFDGCERVLRLNYPEAIYLQSPENVGFAKANNIGFSVSRGANLLFLNPDTEIVGPAIVRLYAALQRLPRAGAVGGTLLNGDGTLQTSCIQSFPTIINQVLAANVLLDLCPKSRLWGTAPLYRTNILADEVEVISGACLMVRRDLFDQIGRFSEDYFMYAEDLDICYKIRRAGWKNYYVPEATVIHFGGGSSKQASGNFSNVMMRESIWRFLRKTRGLYYGSCYRWAMLFSSICRLGLLCFLLPIQALRGRQCTSLASLRKWLAILSWSARRT